MRLNITILTFSSTSTISSVLVVKTKFLEFLGPDKPRTSFVVPLVISAIRDKVFSLRVRKDPRKPRLF